MLRTRQIIKRIETIYCEIKYDDLHIEKIEISKDALINSPGLIIHTIDSLIGCIIGNKIEEYCENNPIETELQKDIKSGKITQLYEMRGNKITAFTKYYKDFEYLYENYDDAYFDFHFCKKLLDKK